MNRFLVTLMIAFFGLLSCKNAEETDEKLKITQQYFDALDQSDASQIQELIADSLLTIVPKYNYQLKFSKTDYLENWLKWDAKFEPTYEILEMNLENESVKAKVVKTDKRILFLMQKPFETMETLHFENNKIVAVSTEYLNFDTETWEKNKTELLNWSAKNHPELKLNQFINIQTEAGGENFRKALESYIKKK